MPLLTRPELIVVTGTVLLGLVAGVVGSFAVLRRRALMGDLLSHAALPGLCVAFLVMNGRDFFGLILGSFLSGLVGIGVIALVTRWTRTKEDAALGIVLSTFFGAGVVLLSIIQHMEGGGSKAGLGSYIYGQAAAMLRSDVLAIAVVAVVGLLTVFVVYKEFKVFSFDPEFARAQGWPTLALDLVMMGLLAIVTVVGLPAVGVVLMAAMLIVPGATARLWTNRLDRMLILSGVLGGLTGGMGTILSSGVVRRWTGFDPLAFGPGSGPLPTGPVIVLCGTAVFLLSVLLAPQRGVVARLWAELRLRWKTAVEHLLRSLYELSEPGLPERASIPFRDLLARRAWSAETVRWLGRWAQRRGYVTMDGDSLRLTPQGLQEGARMVRTHRLWELFLIERANIAPDHVDRDADSIEHFLGPELVAELEARLAADGVATAATAVPESPHPSDASPSETPTHTP